ncbi:hypothetical protein BD309DRAFT_731756 [Dichomitus squalens]|uniref:Uncharacterized protein n=1 Tax=Dichomitus squalens TaxID=114155 RepID=A0A4Q9PV74_9APHY|nr:hypothetical protein BD309DRAFT_731756 [Dichomitus squalens]TBU58522.1 hypothetical protein BD310DRAFT_473086 [Dichomitus squalens]
MLRHPTVLADMVVFSAVARAGVQIVWIRTSSRSQVNVFSRHRPQIVFAMLDANPLPVRSAHLHPASFYRIPDSSCLVL